ncbi:MAG: hypothetical protein ACO3NZ_14750 [Pirellulales bacterium]
MTEALGSSAASWLALVLPWGVFFVGWITAGVLTPSGSDNRPIRPDVLRDDGAFGAEHALIAGNEFFANTDVPDPSLAADAATSTPTPTPGGEA